MTTVTREHLAGLELALESGAVTSPDMRESVRKMIAQASAAPEQEAVYWMREIDGVGTDYTTAKALAEKWQEKGFKVQPLYTHPSAEIERLRAENKRLDLALAQADHNYDCDRAQFEQQLAEAQALLQRTHRDLDACQKVIWLAGVGSRGYGFDPAYCEDAQARLAEIDAFLSATAQPAECQHRYMYFGTQSARLCADCNKVEPAEVKS